MGKHPDQAQEANGRIYCVLHTLPLAATESIRVTVMGRVPKLLLHLSLSVAVVGAAFFAAAWFGGTPPFEGNSSDPYSESRVIRAMPFDVPLPESMSLAVAGRGAQLPYHAQWTSQAGTEELIAQYEQHLAGSPKWRVLVEESTETEDIAVTLARTASDGTLTHFAKLAITRDATQSVVTFDFTPIPSSLAPE